MRTKQKILQLSKGRFKIVAFTIFFNVLLAGSVCGTFAWYTYATRTGFKEPYHGVTVGDLGTLEAGLVSLVELPEHNEYDLVEDKTTLADENKIIYWCNSENGISSRIIRYVVANNGYATESVNPVTTGSDDNIDINGFNLLKAPSILQDHQKSDIQYASQDSYVYVSFVFRYNDPELEIEYVADKDIYFTKCNVEISQDTPEKEIHKAVRVFARGNNNQYIINPTSEMDGEDSVGGILDLNNDGFYDYDENGYEYIYGESDSYDYFDEVTQQDGELPAEERTTFVSNHKKDKYALNEETYVPKIVSYRSMKNFTNKSLPVTTTSKNYHYLAPLDFYIYIEGWDLHVIDEEKGSNFNMAISFEVNP